jgi:hypothetical protein
MPFLYDMFLDEAVSFSQNFLREFLTSKYSSVNVCALGGVFSAP